VRLAHAKVNLWLKIVVRRADGYHLLESLVAFADLADAVEAVPSDGLSLQVGGPQSAALSAEPDNLVLKAARLLAGRAGVSPRAALHLTKNIPVAAGLGGGSADAAAALAELVELWRIALPVEELFELASALGADVPMCLAGRPALASGVGERLAPTPPLPACAILLVNPGVALPTAEVFAARQGGFSTPAATMRRWVDLDDFARMLAVHGNDLEAPAIALRPIVADVLAALRTSAGVRYAAMSGSGATCFALYDDVARAHVAASGLPPAWWRHAGVLASG
jgi:4-diphosphocytidyl-2-C-methyl-D-erythritol kinase